MEARRPVSKPSTINDSQIDPSLLAGAISSAPTNVHATDHLKPRDHNEEEDDSDSSSEDSSGTGTSDGEGSLGDEDGPENERTRPTGKYKNSFQDTPSDYHLMLSNEAFNTATSQALPQVRISLCIGVF